MYVNSSCRMCATDVRQQQLSTFFALFRHTSVLCYGREYFFGSAGIQDCEPVSCFIYHGIIPHVDQMNSTSPDSFISQLESGSTNSFFEMLKVIKSLKVAHIHFGICLQSNLVTCSCKLKLLSKRAPLKLFGSFYAQGCTASRLKSQSAFTCSQFIDVVLMSSLRTLNRFPVLFWYFNC